jgi:hypothetical protein
VATIATEALSDELPDPDDLAQLSRRDATATLLAL